VDLDELKGKLGLPDSISVSEIKALAESGYTVPEIQSILSTEVEPSKIQTLVARLDSTKGLMDDYRKVQADQLTEIQIRLLAAVTEQKIHDAPLRDIVGAYKTLKEKELLMKGQPTEMIGIVGYLRALDAEEKGQEIDVTPLSKPVSSTPTGLPNL
jgi:hypothetical protein